MKFIALTATLALTANAASLRSSSRDALRQLQTDDTSIAACEWTGGRCGTNADCPSCWPDEHYFKSDCYWFATEECGLCKTVGECDSDTTTSTPAPTPEPTVATTLFPTTSPTVSPTESTTEPVSLSPSKTLLGGYTVVIEPDDDVLVSASNYADAIYVYEVDGTVQTLNKEYSGYDSFATSVAISGDYIASSAMFNSDFVKSGGSAYIFKRDTASGSWTLVQSLSPSDAYQNQFFGKTVAMSGNHLLVGSTEQQELGAVYFFELNEETGLYEQIQREQSGLKLGYAMAVKGDKAAVSAAKDNKVYIYEYSSGSWTQMQELACPDCDVAELFGESVSLDGEILVVGSKPYGTWDNYQATSGYEGRAFIYTADSSGTYSLTQTLTGPYTWSDFGSSVSVRDSKIVVGAPGVEDDSLSETGAGFVYTLIDDTWTLTATLTSATPEKRDRVGFSTAIFKDGTVAVGGSGLGSTGGVLEF